MADGGWQLIEFLLAVLFSALAAVAAEDNYRRTVGLYLTQQQDLWIATGVMCDDERGRYFDSLWSVDRDTEVMAARLAATTESTPPFHDYHRLPPAHVTYRGREDARKYLRYLEWQRPWLTPSGQLDADGLAEETRWRMATLEMILDVHNNWDRRGRRLLLQDYRDRVGKDFYDSGQWLSPLPPSAYEYDWFDPKPDGEP